MGLGRGSIALVLWSAGVSNVFGLPSWPADDADIQRAPCRNLITKNAQAIRIFLTDYLRPPLAEETRKFSGLELRGDPRLLTAVEDLLRNNWDSFGGKPVLQVQFTSLCKTVDCILQDPKVFPGGTGKRLLYLYLHFGIKASHYSLPHGEPWKPAELDDIEIAMQDFPAYLFPLGPPHPLVRFEHGYTLRNRNDTDSNMQLFGNATIYLFDPWTESSSPTRQMTLFHELGHVLEKFDWRVSPEWLQLSGWPADGKPKKEEKADSSKFVSSYAMTNSAEDFAESVVGFRYKPQELQKINPAKYSFIRDSIFGGIEYTNESQCRGVMNYSDRARLWLQAKLSEFLTMRTQEIELSLMKICGEMSLQYLTGKVFEDLSDTQLAACTTRGLGSRAVSHSGVLPADSKVPHLAEIVGERISPIALSEVELQLVKSSVRQNLAKALRAYLLQPADFNSSFFPGHKTIEESCKHFGEYAYQNADRIDLWKYFDASPSLFGFKHREPLTSFAAEFCLFTQRDQSVPNRNLLNAVNVDAYLTSVGLKVEGQPVRMSKN